MRLSYLPPGGRIVYMQHMCVCVGEIVPTCTWIRFFCLRHGLFSVRGLPCSLFLRSLPVQAGVVVTLLFYIDGLVFENFHILVGDLSEWTNVLKRKIRLIYLPRRGRVECTHVCVGEVLRTCAQHIAYYNSKKF